jgi:hypothetical protein
MPISAILTIAFMLFVVVGLIGWDIVVAANKIPNSVDTISGRMRIWGSKTLLIPWVWIVLFGHFYGPKTHLMQHKISIPILLVLTAIVVFVGTLMNKGETTVSWPLFLVILNVGAIAGAVLWPQ